VVAWSAKYLAARGVADARLNAEILLAHVLGWKRIDLYTRFEEPLDPEALGRFRGLLKSRGRRVPVEYLTGRVEFMGLELAVDPRVLIPRPETEILVERAVEILTQSPRPRMLDLGTGSGCVAVAIAARLPGAKVVATDRSLGAIAVARANAERHGVARRIGFRTGDLYEALGAEDGPFDLIASNPPYVSPAASESLEPEIREHEPAEALFTSGDPLEVVREIVRGAPDWLAPGGHLLVEIGAGSGPGARGLVAATFGLELVEIARDLAGIERVVVARRA
jgi:release factor glutamine methyltransferase